MIYDRNMPHSAIYWQPGVNTGSGFDFSAVVPVVIKCRWQDDVSVQRNAQGDEFIASHVVYCSQDVQNEGFLLLGSIAPAPLEDPRDLGALEIKQVYRTDSLDGSVKLIKAVL